MKYLATAAMISVLVGAIVESVLSFRFEHPYQEPCTFRWAYYHVTERYPNGDVKQAAFERFSQPLPCPQPPYKLKLPVSEMIGFVGTGWMEEESK